jgi:putative flippase GtrA
MLDLLAKLDRLIDRVPVSPRFFRFAMVGASGTVVSFAALWAINWLLPSSWGAWEHRAALAGSIVVAIFTNFLLNYHWTWADTDRATGVADWFAKLGRFYLVSAVAATVQYAVALLVFERTPLNELLLAASDALLGETRLINDPGLYAAQAIGIGTAMFINYFANHLWTFRDKSDDSS